MGRVVEGEEGEIIEMSFGREWQVDKDTKQNKTKKKKDLWLCKYHNLRQ